MSAVVNFLALQVRLGKITVEQVPEKYRADVQDLLESGASA